MLKEMATYSVLLLPGIGCPRTGHVGGKPRRSLTGREIAARGLSLREADAWIRTYNDVMEGQPATAVIAEEKHEVPVNRRAA